MVGVQGGLAPLARELGVDGLFPEAGAVGGWNLLEFDPKTSSSAAPAAGRTSSTVSGRPSSINGSIPGAR